jgi:hypothetical protein
MKWFNHPGWGNTGSSCHVMIFDRIPKNLIGDMWSNVDQELQEFFPVPTIILAPWYAGTWHGNWTNNMTLGVECRNVGRIKGDKDTYLGKPTVTSPNGKQVVESFSWDQILCCINVGRLCQAWTSFALDMDWILTHQCVWALKRDAGPAFPIHKIREHIHNFDKRISDPRLFPTVAPNSGEGTEWMDTINELRDEPDECLVKWEQPTDVVIDDTEKAKINLYQMGFHSGDCGTHRERAFRNAVRWYQRSTSAFAKTKHDRGRVLKPDGAYGPKTAASLHQRMGELGII